LLSIPEIFEPFYTTKELGKGTGLGLSIVYGIIKQHNGFIDVYSEPEKGTTFKIYLPLIKGTQPIITEKAQLPAAPIGGGETILVAEDDATLRNLTSEVLKRFGYTVIAAVDGVDAVTKYVENRGKIQLLLLDMVMPKKSGKEIYDEIKKMGGEVKTVFTSGYPKDFVNTGDPIGEGYDLIMKPVSPQNLLRKIREILDKD
jgi:CheY-like chemotaxis protein